MKPLLLVALFVTALFLSACESKTTKSDTNAPTPEDSGADKSAEKGKPRFPTPPPK